MTALTVGDNQNTTHFFLHQITGTLPCVMDGGCGVEIGLGPDFRCVSLLHSSVRKVQ